MKDDHRSPGSVLIFAVLLLAAGVFVLTGIAQIGATQALVGQNEWQVLDQRVRVENIRAIARQFMLARMFVGPITNAVTYSFDNVSGFTLEAGSASGGSDYWTTFSTTNTNENLNINPFTLMERGGFYRAVVRGAIFDEAGETEWNFQVRTRSPVAAGYPYVQHMPGNIVDNPSPPYIDMNLREKINGFPEMARMMLSSVTNIGADTNGYEGFLDVPVGIASPIPFESIGPPVPLVEDPTKLQIEIDLDSADPEFMDVTEFGRALTYTVPATAVYTNVEENTTNNLPVTHLLLRGTDQDGLLPLQIVILEENTNLTTLVLSGRNSGPVDTFSGGRSVYVNFRRPPDFNGTNKVVAENITGPWRIGITAHHVDIDFETAGAEIIGGVRSDRSITGAPNLRRELTPRGLDYVADRMMWLEDYRTP